MTSSTDSLSQHVPSGKSAVVRLSQYPQLTDSQNMALETLSPQALRKELTYNITLETLKVTRLQYAPTSRVKLSWMHSCAGITAETSKQQYSHIAAA